MDPFDALTQGSLGNFFSPETYDVQGLFENLRQEKPAMAQELQESNTDRLSGLFDQMQFYAEDEAHHPLSKEGLETLPYRNVRIPFGLEDKSYFWNPSGRGAARAAIRQREPGRFAEDAVFSGRTQNSTIIHEGRHPLIDMNKQAEEEYNRGIDYYDALVNGDEERALQTINFIRESYGDESVEALLKAYGKP